ncbi:MAG: DUF1127 domain-containing protein [Pseudomonadota bacterium]
MALRPDNTLITNREMLAELFRKIGEILSGLVMRSPQYAAVEKLNRLSDADLAAKGLTRAQVAEQLFRHDG